MVPAHASQLVLIRRRLTGDFTQIPNSLIRDKAMSWKSLGLIIYLLSLPAARYHVSLERLCAAKLDGEAAVRSAIKQLESLGYMKIIRERSTKGRYVRSRWLVSDHPIEDWAPYLENPVVDKPAQDRPAMSDPGTTNTGFVEIRENTITTTPTAPAALLQIADGIDKEMWSWLCQKISIDPDKALHDSSGLDPSLALDVLAEVYQRKVQGGIQKTVPQFLASLLHKARAGKFNLAAGTDIRKELPEILQRQHARQRIEAAALESANAAPPRNGISPQEHIRRAREILAGRVNLNGGHKK